MKVITFSRTFPKTHPRAGDPTFFVEKTLLGLIEAGQISISKCCECARQFGFSEDHPMYYIHTLRKYDCEPKRHTIRAGNRWKVGELFSPRVWSGKPYVSKQIEFAPPIKIEKIWDISIKIMNGEDVTVKLNNRSMLLQDLMPIALNDGLELNDFVAWFNLHPKKKEQTFTGQIICWNPDLNY
jgi:hypothetical protein